MTIYELSTYPRIMILSESHSIIDRSAANLLLKWGIINYGLLENAIVSGQKEFQYDYFRAMLKEAYNTLDKNNKRKITAPIYSFDAYEQSRMDTELLNFTDSQTSCIVLPFTSPLCKIQHLGTRLGDIKIKEAKEMLSSYGSNSQNALEMCILSFGHAKSEQVANLIKFYEDQIIRSAEEVDLKSFGGSLFLKDKTEKKRIVSVNATEMCDYLLQEGNEFIFGYLDENKKNTLKGRVHQPNDKIGLNSYFKFIELITNYTTLHDLETTTSRKRALDRFIIK